MDIAKVITNAHSISVDLDGVLLALFMNKVWLGDPFDKNGADSNKKRVMWKKLCIVFEDPIQQWAQKLRKTLPYAYSVIDGWKKQGKKLYLVTARKTHVKGSTYTWLKNNSYLDLFDEICMNTKYQKASLYKYEQLAKLQPDIHIDDDPVVIEHLASNYPDKYFIHFNSPRYIPAKNDNVFVVKSWSELLGV